MLNDQKKKLQAVQTTRSPIQVGFDGNKEEYKDFVFAYYKEPRIPIDTPDGKTIIVGNKDLEFLRKRGYEIEIS